MTLKKEEVDKRAIRVSRAFYERLEEQGEGRKCGGKDRSSSQVEMDERATAQAERLEQRDDGPMCEVDADVE